jgi:hypothetical protein
VHFVKRLKWKVQTNCGGSIGAREEGHNKLLYYKAIPSTKNVSDIIRVSDFNPTVEKQHLAL